MLKFPKPKKQKKGSKRRGLSDSNLLKLHRKAVFKLWGGVCAFPGCANNALTVHHIVHRHYKFGRYNPYNGILCCIEHHRFFDSPAGHNTLVQCLKDNPTDNYSWEKIEKIAAVSNIKVYLAENRLSMDEFLEGEKKRLEEIINGA